MGQGRGWREARRGRESRAGTRKAAETRQAGRGRNIPEYADILAERNGWTKEVQTHTGRVQIVKYTDPTGEYSILASSTMGQRARLRDAVLREGATGNNSRYVDGITDGTRDKRKALKKFFNKEKYHA
ncbi:hypothetical protein SEA_OHSHAGHENNESSY_1 [Mycobacterium phage OhShagHennessy]|uniref:Uncharacterized protein n=1 Tax=Mycobacterium phage OhShagHennessy TaxID=2801895 RepID=A0A7U0GCJ3_9CAUD|nr:hypothetical protein KNV76_gp001 [Mycobacterium phage OhShagHennessy]ASR85984.1 hypothetical protein SEA_APPLETREE2_1 [Mycobacterium phage Appletree2]QQV92704.1 hypothetical protein SEA_OHSHAGHENNESSY_1 [Mycobacterium phage OhShagHennessy]